MIRRFSKFVNLPHGEKKLLIEAFYTLIIVKVTLSIIPFKKVLSYYDRPMDSLSDLTFDDQLPEKVANAVNLMANQLPNTHCLPRALATKKLLSNYGCSSKLHIGAMKNGNGEFLAHAWIEKNGKVIIGELDDLITFSAFPI